MHYDHHLEHHVRPRLNWYELPRPARETGSGAGARLHRVTLPQFFLEVFLTRSYKIEAATTTTHGKQPGRRYRRELCGMDRYVGERLKPPRIA